MCVRVLSLSSISSSTDQKKNETEISLCTFICEALECGHTTSLGFCRIQSNEKNTQNTNKQTIAGKKISTELRSMFRKMIRACEYVLVRFIIYVLCVSISTSFMRDVNILMMKTFIHWLCRDQATQPRFIIWIRSSNIYLNRKHLRAFVRYTLSFSQSLSHSVNHNHTKIHLTGN